MNRTWTGLAVRKLSKQRNHVDQDLKMFPRVGSTAVLGWLRRRAHMVCIPNFCRETDSISIPRSFSQVWAPGCQFRLPAQRTRALTRPKSEWKPSSWVHQLLPATSFYHFLSHTSCYPQVPQFSPESPEAASPVPCHTCPEQQLENHWTGNTGKQWGFSACQAFFKSSCKPSWGLIFGSDYCLAHTVVFYRLNQNVSSCDNCALLHLLVCSSRSSFRTCK